MPFRRIVFVEGVSVKRWIVLLVVGALGCEAPPVELADAGRVASPDTRPPPKADDPGHVSPPPTSAAAPCDQPGSFSCADDHALYCQDGYAGGRWIDRGACEAGTQCAEGWGCAPLPRCGAEGSLACVGNDVFRCEADAPWRFVQRCPDGLPCVHGRGCPNALEVGALCDLDDGPRCVDGMVQRCVSQGIDFVWSMPGACPADASCLAGQGCVRPDGCQRRGAATCDDAETARYCVEQDDGVLGWGRPLHCRKGCIEGRGCAPICRREGFLGACLD